MTTVGDEEEDLSEGGAVAVKQQKLQGSRLKEKDDDESY
jgi:hypothetical protein